MDTKSNQICAYLAEQANYLLGRIENAPGSLDHQKHNARCKEIESAKILIAESLGFISVICRDGATEKQLIEFEETGARMNSTVRF